MTRRDSGTQLQDRTEAARPRLYRVLLLNDDFTPMDFVVMVLAAYFRKSLAEAERIMLAVHQQGQGVAGVYPRDIAQTKAEQVTQHARQEGHPLRLSVEPEGES